MRDRYLRQVRLLLNVLPDVASEPVFALKGGTAINLFYREMPRLSVDIDLAYVPVRDRRSSLAEIDDALSRFAAATTSRNPRVRARRTEGGGETGTRIVLNDGPTHIKVETSPVMRGTVYPARPMVVSRTVMDRYGFVEANVLAFEDLYGGKLVAALDRQHPRDVFDVKMLYDNEGLTDDLFRTFMVYVVSSGRPAHELLAPRAPLRRESYDNEFVGMTREAVPWTALVEARRRLVEDIGSRLRGDVAAFLLSVHDAEPDFGLIGLPRAALLPAVRWKVENLERLRRANPEKHGAQRDALERLVR